MTERRNKQVNWIVCGVFDVKTSKGHRNDTTIWSSELSIVRDRNIATCNRITTSVMEKRGVRVKDGSAFILPNWAETAWYPLKHKWSTENHHRQWRVQCSFDVLTSKTSHTIQLTCLFPSFGHRPVLSGIDSLRHLPKTSLHTPLMAFLSPTRAFFGFSFYLLVTL